MGCVPRQGVGELGDIVMRDPPRQAHMGAHAANLSWPCCQPKLATRVAHWGPLPSAPQGPSPQGPSPQRMCSRMALWAPADCRCPAVVHCSAVAAPTPGTCRPPASPALRTTKPMPSGGTAGHSSPDSSCRMYDTLSPSSRVDSGGPNTVGGSIVARRQRPWRSTAAYAQRSACDTESAQDRRPTSSSEHLSRCGDGPESMGHGQR